MKYRIGLALLLSAFLLAAAGATAQQKPAQPSSAQPSSTQQPAAPAAAGPASSTHADPQTVAELSKPSGGPDGGLYTVRDGNKVDPKTLQGWKTWRALACDRCHGAAQQGLVGPALVQSLHNLTKQEFHDTIMNGRPEKGMPPFSASKMVTQNWEGLYAYLKGRADGLIKPGHLYPLEPDK